MDLPTDSEDYNVIPVRTWVSGSPYKVKKVKEGDFDQNQPVYNGGADFEGGLENYFFGDEVPNLEGEGNAEGDDDEDDEDYEDDVEEEEGEDGEEYEEEYEDGHEENENEYQGEDNQNDIEDVLEDAALMEGYQRLFPSENDDNTPEMSLQLQETKSMADNYLNAYQELMNYMASPRKPMGSPIKVKSNLFISHPSHPAHYDESEDGEDDDDEDAGQDEFVFVPKKLTKKAGEKKKLPAHLAKGAAKKVNKSNKPKKDHTGSGKKLSEVEEKHRIMLAEIAFKRKQEEEELLKQDAIMQEKRKKFKEALLEKALKARREQEEVQPTKIATAQNIIQTDADLVRREEERREYIAQVRRKFKEQHKKVLATLLAKKKENDSKAEQQILVDEMKKMKRKKKLLKMLEKKHEEELMRVQSAEENVPKSVGKVAAGSALAVIRQRSVQNNLVGNDNSVSVKKGKSNNNDEEEEESEQNGEAEMAMKLLAKQQKNKVAEYIKQLAEQKKKDEIEKKKQEDRQKRRMMLLSQRLAMEAQERKQMNAEDQAKYHLNNEKNHAPEEKQVSQRKVTAEMAEAMAERLKQKSLSTRNNAETSPSNMPTQCKPKERKEPKAPAEPKESREHREKESKDRDTKDVKESKEIKEREVKESRLPPRPRRSAPENKADDSDDEDDDITSNVRSSLNNVPLGPPARDFNDWKRKNSVPADGKVFCMTGWYPCVKQALLDRGWYFNPDPASPYCHLKWTLRSIDVNQDTLQPWQLTNHYLKNVAITTKVGLIKSLQSLVWLADVDAKDIIPRAYDLSIAHEMQAFLDDYRCQTAEQILKQLYYSVCKQDSPILYNKKDREVFSPPVSSRDYPNSKPDTEDSDEIVIPPVPTHLIEPETIKAVQINPAVFDAACIILENALKPYDDSYLDETFLHQTIHSAFEYNKQVGDLEWELISSYNVHAPIRSLPYPPPDPIDAFLHNTVKDEEGGSNTQLTIQQYQKEKKKYAKYLFDKRDNIADDIQSTRPFTLLDLQRIHRILCSLSLYHRGQWGLNGSSNSTNNMWIVKPAAKSRGRGITTFNDIHKLLKYVEAGSGFSTQWIVQKYIENPLVIAKRKFDLRQWVLVTNWNPLTIYFYDECYARFSVEEYTNSSSDMENCYVHLVNNSIGKNSENFNKTIKAENGVDIEGYMWGFEQFREYLKFSTDDQDVLINKIQPRMKDIAKWSLMCASEMIEHRKNSWELYGFDYMVDDQYNTWLIEINSSPACDYSTPTTERYVQKALVELLAVVLDMREWEGMNKKTRGEKPDTGGWECIYTGPVLELPVGSFGTEMSLKGEGMKVRGANRGGNSIPINNLAYLKENRVNDTVGMSVKSLSGIKPSQPIDTANANSNSSYKRPTAPVIKSSAEQESYGNRSRRVVEGGSEPHSSPQQGGFDDSDGEEEGPGEGATSAKNSKGAVITPKVMLFDEEGKGRGMGGVGEGKGMGGSHMGARKDKRQQATGQTVPLRVVTLDFPGL